MQIKETMIVHRKIELLIDNIFDLFIEEPNIFFSLGED